MTRSGILFGITAVLAGTTALLVILGTVYNLFLLVFAIPFAISTYFFWYHATGRIQYRIRTEPRFQRTRRTDSQGSHSHSSRSHWNQSELSRTEAYEILGLDTGAGMDAIRRAYRDKVKTVHPDGTHGNQADFKQVRAAYERLQNE